MVLILFNLLFLLFCSKLAIVGCGQCTNGTTNLRPNYLKDCAGLCSGPFVTDAQGLCSLPLSDGNTSKYFPIPVSSSLLYQRQYIHFAVPGIDYSVAGQRVSIPLSTELFSIDIPFNFNFLGDEVVSSIYVSALGGIFLDYYTASLTSHLIDINYSK